jgi:2-hydroxy-3-keto-5-methylthiopentenyl-1-phosphate phosphatase
VTIAVDFDGTIVEHRYPEIGNELPFATETLKMLIAEHHKLILWTVREDDLLQEAVDWCKERGVEFYAVNRDYPEESLENNIISQESSRWICGLMTVTSVDFLTGEQSIR